MTNTNKSGSGPDVHLSFVGFGEAAMAFTQGWTKTLPPEDRPAFHAFDIKTGSADPAVRAAKQADYERNGVTGASDLKHALEGSSVVFSMVTADQALTAAQMAAGAGPHGVLYFDCNSCAPDTKRRAASLIEEAGGSYVDTAVMAPVHPKFHKTPLLLSGPHTERAQALLTGLGCAVEIAEGDVGTASAIKMVRSIMIKGLEALGAECVLAARKSGVEDEVIASLDASFPGFGWGARISYMLERMATHGIRRAAEMREVALTIEHLGLSSAMATATTGWQQTMGDLAIDANSFDSTDYKVFADVILERLSGDDEETETQANTRLEPVQD